MSNEIESKWIKFELEPKMSARRKTLVWLVKTKERDEFLGSVGWLPKFRGYAFCPPVNTFTYFEQQCLRDIAAFIEEQNRLHKEHIRELRKSLKR